MRTLSLAVLATSVALAGGAARAETHTPAAENPRAAHAETDRNKDGMVDREEFHERQVDIFYTADLDKNGNLTEVEFATLDTKTTFTEMDKNKNGSVSMYEFISYRFAQFDVADTDHDGLLSVEEVEAYVNR
jgi:Ca2+-binding EF-hand superfamily protein